MRELEKAYGEHKNCGYMGAPGCQRLIQLPGSEGNEKVVSGPSQTCEFDDALRGVESSLVVSSLWAVTVVQG